MTNRDRLAIAVLLRIAAVVGFTVRGSPRLSNDRRPRLTADTIVKDGSPVECITFDLGTLSDAPVTVRWFQDGVPRLVRVILEISDAGEVRAPPWNPSIAEPPGWH